MSKSLKDLAVRMRKTAKMIPEIGNSIAATVAYAAAEHLIDITPVDTSTALSNWQVGLGAKPSGSIAAHTLGTKGSSRGPSTSQAKQDALVELNQKLPGQSAFISNVVPYIVDLDNGSSRQFAGGFTARALTVVSGAAEQQRRKVFSGGKGVRRTD